MARLLTVINERNKLKNEFLTFLEFWYIQTQKNKEDQQELKQLTKLKKAETKDEIKLRIDKKVKKLEAKMIRNKIFSKPDKSMSGNINETVKDEAVKDEVVKGETVKDEAVNEKVNEGEISEQKTYSKFDEQKHDKLNNISSNSEQTSTTENKTYTSRAQKIAAKEEYEDKFKNFVRILTKEEESMADSLSKRYSNNSLLETYIQNPRILIGKEKRKIIAKINSDRASKGKLIFMKEMAAISYAIKNTKQSSIPEINKLETLI